MASDSPHKSWDIFHGGEAISILSESECSAIADKVRSAEDIWIERAVVPGHPIKFHTLGGATYLDLHRPTYDGYRKSSVSRMHELFGDLYDKLCLTLAAPLGEEVIIAEDLAPPGFHIYRGNPASGVGLLYGGSIHVDGPHLQHEHLFSEIEDVLSFTLPISLPQDGPAGMYYWPSGVGDGMYGFAFEKSPQQILWLNLNKRSVTYSLGSLVMHDGRTVHQLANMCRSDFDDWRITLQGHGIFSRGKWHLYF